MELQAAIMRVGRAGREMGGASETIIERLMPGEIEARVRVQLERDQATYERLKGSKYVDGSALEPNEEDTRGRVVRFLYGVCVGRVMAEDQAVLTELDKVYDEWLRGDYQ
jgi:hypothetical protein